MNKLLLAAAAILSASLGASALAADTAPDAKAASKNYYAATSQAKADFNTASAACKKLAADKQSACYKDARIARRKARDDAGDTYAKLMNRPEPSPGGE